MEHQQDDDMSCLALRHPHANATPRDILSARTCKLEQRVDENAVLVLFGGIN